MCRVNMDALFGSPIDPVAPPSKAAAAVASKSFTEQRKAYDRLPVDGWDIFESLVSTEKKCQILDSRLQDVMGMMATLFDGFCVCHGDGSILMHLPTLETHIGDASLWTGANIINLAANDQEKQRLRAFCSNLKTNLKIEVTLQTSQGTALDATLFATMLTPGGRIASGDFLLGFQFSLPLQRLDADIMAHVEACSQLVDVDISSNDISFEMPPSPKPACKVMEDCSWIMGRDSAAWPLEVGETAIVSRTTVVKNTFIHCSSSDADDEDSVDKNGRANSAPPKLREMPVKRMSPLKLRTVVSKMVTVMNVVKIWSHCQRAGDGCECGLKVNQADVSWSVHQSPSQGVIVPSDGVIRIKSWPQVGHSPFIPNLIVKNTFIHLAGDCQVVERSRQRASSVPPHRPEALDSQEDPFCFNAAHVDDDIASLKGGATSIKSAYSYCESTCSGWQSSAASDVSTDDVQVTLGNRVRDRNLMTEGICEDRLPEAQLSPMLLARQGGLCSIGSKKHCSGECYPCLMEAWYRNGKSPQPCKFGSLCGRCHEKHSHAEVRKLKRHMHKK